MNKMIFCGENCTVKYNRYRGNNIAIQLFDEDGFPMATATMWVEGLGKDEVAIKDYSENAGMLNALLSADIVHPPHRRINTGFVLTPMCKLKQVMP